MDIFDAKITVSEICVAVFVPRGKGTPVHKNRAAHGLAFNVGITSVYRFDTGETLTAHPGECIYLPRGSNYTVSSVDGDDTSGTYAINFLMLDEPSAPSPCLVQIKGQDEVLSAFVKAESAWRKRPADFYEECFISLYKIIKTVKKERSRYLPKHHTLAVIAPALQYIDENYTRENISLSHLAKICNISEPYLRRLFQSAFSVSPAVYMRNMRISHAKELLRSGEYSVTDSALLSGFNDPAYFAREFKKTVGMSPKDYLKTV